MELSLIEDMVVFFNARQDRIYLCKSESYECAYNEFTKKLSEFKEKIPIDAHLMLIDLLDTKTNCDIIRNRDFYMHGFKDCFKLIMCV